MKTLYPSIEPFNHFFLQTNSNHSVYVEQSGNPQGFPVIFLHGGPCSGTKPNHRCFFNPSNYHIILMDQRGCGQSTPYGEVDSNTTQDIIDDMEQIRKQLNIEKWLLFGGSWGATLALLYAQQHTSTVAGMIIRGVFLARAIDQDWYINNEGVGRIYPEKWKQLVASVPAHSGDHLIQQFYDIAFGDDELTKRRAVKAWMQWGGQVALLDEYQEDEKPFHVTEKMVLLMQMEMHFAKHNYFITEDQIIKNCDLLQQVPTIIIHGRRDLVCPMESATSLSIALPHAEFIQLSDSGHIASGDDMIDALVRATDKMLELI